MSKKSSYTAKLLKARADLAALADDKCGLLIRLNFEDDTPVDMYGSYAVFGFYENKDRQCCSIILPDVWCSTIAIIEEPDRDFEFNTNNDEMVIRRIDGAPFSTLADVSTHKLTSIIIKRYTNCY